MGDSVVKDKLRSLCCVDGWSYGIFWRYDSRNSMLLTFDDAYYEDQMGQIIESLLLQVHMLGEGIVGEVALTGRQQWMNFDAFSDWNYTSDKNSMFHCQISCGVQTIAVISVEPWGVLQVGSTQKIIENAEFLNRTQILFRDVTYADGLLPLLNAPSPLDCEANDNNGLLSSIVASGNYININHIGEQTQDSSFSITQHERMDILEDPPYNRSQQQTMCAETQLLSTDKPSTQSQQLLSRPVLPSSPIALSCEGSIITSLRSHISSEMTLPHADLPSTGAMSPAFCVGTIDEFQNNTTFNPLKGLGDYFSAQKIDGDNFNHLISSSILNSSTEDSEVIFPDATTSELTVPEKNKPADVLEDISEFFTVDDISQCFANSASNGTHEAETMLDKTYPQSTGVDSSPSCLVEGDMLINDPLPHTKNSLQISPSGTSDKYVQEKYFHVNITDSNMPTAIGSDHEQVTAMDFGKNQVMPIETGNNSAITTTESECVSELITSTMAPRRGLFSELGIDELLDGIASTNSATSSFEVGPSTAKRRKMESSLGNCTQVELGSLPCSVGSVTSMHNWERNTLIPKKESFWKSQVGLWIDDSYSINVGTAAGAKPKRSEEPTKVSRKRARPGESTRPRPKDRQQIQDRIKELRGIVPNGQKSSIDSLLDHTIKYMLFLQSVTKYADKLVQNDEPKLIDQENGVILKDGNVDGGSRGVTWAYEVGSQTTVCPIIVEDLSPPGQMLIEMLCEDRGFFLEIADVVRGIGLTILKGMMEVHGTKIRARFTVEAQRHITRMHIFWSLAQLLQDTATSGNDTTDRPKKTSDSQLPFLSDYQLQPLVSLPKY